MNENKNNVSKELLVPIFNLIKNKKYNDALSLLETISNKMNKFSNPDSQIVAASDAFFPFVDGIEKLVQSGVRAVVQPSGSIRDKEIINFANETETVLLFSKTRHFRHQIFDLFLQQE